MWACWHVLSSALGLCCVEHLVVCWVWWLKAQTHICTAMGRACGVAALNTSSVHAVDINMTPVHVVDMNMTEVHVLDMNMTHVHVEWPWASVWCCVMDRGPRMHAWVLCSILYSSLSYGVMPHALCAVWGIHCTTRLQCKCFTSQRCVDTCSLGLIPWLNTTGSRSKAWRFPARSCF
jgi:hypothetical protein